MPEQDAPEPQPLAQRTDPMLILEGIKTTAEAAGVGYAIYKGTKNDAPSPQPEPELPEVILPDGVDVD